MFAGNVLHKKLVVVGDGFCGKTSLLMAYRLGIFPEEYVPTVFEADVMDVVIDGKKVMLGLFDTAGQEDYDRLRPLSYPNTDVALICFSLNDADTLMNVVEKWAPEVHHFCPSVPILLVGTKKDLLSASNSNTTNRDHIIHGKPKVQPRPVQSSEAKMIARKIGASDYLECSAKMQEGIFEVFYAAAKLALGRTEKKKKKLCLIL